MFIDVNYNLNYLEYKLLYNYFGCKLFGKKAREYGDDSWMEMIGALTWRIAEILPLWEDK